MRAILGWVTLAACAVALPSMGRAADPVALVESVTGTPAGVDIMDYLTAGQIVALRPGEALVIDYLQSCMRETIAGGTVTIGAERSDVRGGKVERERVQCDGGRLKLSSDQAAKSGVVVFRAPPKPQLQSGDLVIERHLYGASPMIAMKDARSLVIERLDRSGERLEIAVQPNHLLRGSFYDLAGDQKPLAVGGIYRATAGSRSIVFEVDRYAKPGKTAIAGRLLQF